MSVGLFPIAQDGPVEGRTQVDEREFTLSSREPGVRGRLAADQRTRDHAEDPCAHEHTLRFHLTAIYGESDAALYAAAAVATSRCPLDEQPRGLAQGARLLERGRARALSTGEANSAPTLVAVRQLAG